MYKPSYRIFQHQYKYDKDSRNPNDVSLYDQMYSNLFLKSFKISKFDWLNNFNTEKSLTYLFRQSFSNNDKESLSLIFETLNENITMIPLVINILCFLIFKEKSINCEMIGNLMTREFNLLSSKPYLDRLKTFTIFFAELCNNAIFTFDSLLTFLVTLKSVSSDKFKPIIFTGVFQFLYKYLLSESDKDLSILKNIIHSYIIEFKSADKKSEKDIFYLENFITYFEKTIIEGNKEKVVSSVFEPFYQNKRSYVDESISPHNFDSDNLFISSFEFENGSIEKEISIKERLSLIDPNNKVGLKKSVIENREEEKEEESRGTVLKSLENKNLYFHNFRITLTEKDLVFSELVLSLLYSSMFSRKIPAILLYETFYVKNVESSVEKVFEKKESLDKEVEEEKSWEHGNVDLATKIIFALFTEEGVSVQFKRHLFRVNEFFIRSKKMYASESFRLLWEVLREGSGKTAFEEFSLNKFLELNEYLFRYLISVDLNWPFHSCKETDDAYVKAFFSLVFERVSSTFSSEKLDKLERTEKVFVKQKRKSHFEEEVSKRETYRTTKELVSSTNGSEKIISLVSEDEDKLLLFKERNSLTASVVAVFMSKETLREKLENLEKLKTFLLWVKEGNDKCDGTETDSSGSVSGEKEKQIDLVNALFRELRDNKEVIIMMVIQKLLELGILDFKIVFEWIVEQLEKFPGKKGGDCGAVVEIEQKVKEENEKEKEKDDSENNSNNNNNNNRDEKSESGECNVNGKTEENIREKQDEVHNIDVYTLFILMEILKCVEKTLKIVSKRSGVSEMVINKETENEKLNDGNQIGSNEMEFKYLDDGKLLEDIILTTDKFNSMKLNSILN